MCDETPRDPPGGRWVVDSQGFLRSRLTGAPLARIGEGCLWLYDKARRGEVPLTREDWQRLFGDPTPDPPDP
jgi:hypothetical protein